FAKLDRGQPYAAGSPEHEKRLPRLEPAAVDQRMDRSCISQKQRRSFGETAVLRQSEGGALGNDDLFGQAAEAGDGNHAIPHNPAGHAFADRLDLAGNLTAGSEGPRGPQLIFVLDDQHIGKIDRGGAHADEKLAWSSFRIVDVAELKRVRRSG